ncbi:MAG: hypothetical protein H7Y36_00335 [Armatimonadetes bacterium]|nr:hypothetical protein [Akkermansiaceae bacterium]
MPLDRFSDPIGVTSRVFDYGVPAKEFVPMGRIVLPDVGKKFVIVFAPTSTGYRVFPVRTDDPDFKADDTIIFNFSPMDVGVELGSAKQVVRSMKIGKLRPAPAVGARFFQATFYQQSPDGPLIFNNTRWPSSDRLRVFAFVFKDPVTGNMTYRDMRD